MLDDAQIERYSRQIILPEVGGRGQERLLQSRVALIGTGPLGQLTATYLAGAGVGRLDWHSGSNDDPETKASLRGELADINPDTDCHWCASTDAVGAEPPDVVIAAFEDGHHPGHANRVALAARVPLVAGCVRGTTGWVGLFAGHLPDQGCLECAPPPPLAEQDAAPDALLKPAVTGLVASLQATEVMKLLLDIGDGAIGTVWHYDGTTSALEAQPVIKRRGCAACGR